MSQLSLERLCYDYRYAAPEMIRGGPFTPRLDFYSLGCLGYELFCGTPPFVAENAFDLGVKHLTESYILPSKHENRLGSQGDSFFKHLLAKSPSDRFSDIAQALEALDSLRDQLRAPSESGSRPVTLIGRQSLVQFDPLHSVVKLTDKPGTEPPSEERSWLDCQMTVTLCPLARRQYHPPQVPYRLVPLCPRKGHLPNQMFRPRGTRGICCPPRPSELGWWSSASTGSSKKSAREAWAKSGWLTTSSLTGRAP